MPAARNTSPEEQESSGWAKLTINLAPEIHAELKELARSRGLTLSELVRRAVALDKFVYEHRDGEFLLKRDGQTHKLILIDV